MEVKNCIFGLDELGIFRLILLGDIPTGVSLDKRDFSNDILGGDLEFATPKEATESAIYKGDLIITFCKSSWESPCDDDMNIDIVNLEKRLTV